MSLYSNEKVYDESNYKELVGNGEYVEVNGHKRFLSRIKPPMGSPNPVISTPFKDSGIKKFSRSDLSLVLKEQKEKKARGSDYCDFPAFDQDGLPTCWAIGTAQMMTVQRRIQGLPHVQLSGCSLAVPISGGHQGGFEGDSLAYAAKYGVAPVSLWPENDTTRRLTDDPKIIEARKSFMALEYIDCEDDADAWLSGLAQSFIGVFAYDWMSHVMMMADAVEVEAGSFGFRPRNSWSEQWGAKNDLGFAGFATYREGRRGTPNSGYLIRQVTASFGVTL